MTGAGPTGPAGRRADDLGYDPAIDAGILEAHRNGVVTATSALVDGPFAVRRRSPGRPAQPRGRPAPRAARRARGPEAEREILRQLRAFQEARGAPPAHLDGHRHVHAEPAVLAAVLRVAGPLRLRVRALDAAMRDRIRAPARGPPTGSSAMPTLRPCWTPPALAAAAGAILPGTTEIMIDPATCPPTCGRASPPSGSRSSPPPPPAVRAAFSAAGRALVGVLPE